MSRTLALCQKRLQRASFRRHALIINLECKSFSSVVSRLKVEPGQLIHGLTRERIESDPSIAEYILANFPEAFIDEQNLLESIDLDDDEDDPFAVTEVYPRNIRPLTAFLRDPVNEEGSHKSRTLRKFEDFIPGLLYGSDPTLGIYSSQKESKFLIKTPNRLLQRELDRYHRSFESRVYDLTIFESPDGDSDGTVHRVTPQNLQKHPVFSSMFYCANFCRYHARRPLKLPIKYANEEESVALKRDGFILPIKRFIECFVEEGVDIPENIELECTGLNFKDVIRKDRLLIPDGVRISDRVESKGDGFIIGVVFGRSRGLAADEDEDAATPAAAAAAPAAAKKKKEKE